MSWSTLLWTRPIRVVATIGLTISLSIGNSNLPWPWILSFAAIIVVHEIGTCLRGRRSSNRLELQYETVHGRVLRLIADLAELAGGKFDLWVVDIYLPGPLLSFLTGRRSVVTLVRELSLGLTDVRDVPLKVSANEGLFSVSFAESSRQLWWNSELAPSSSGENQWNKLSEVENNKLSVNYGAVSVNPIVDHLRKKCIGLLVIHVKPDAEIVTTAVGVFTASAGERRLVEACNDIHKELGK